MKHIRVQLLMRQSLAVDRGDDPDENIIRIEVTCFDASGDEEKQVGTIHALAVNFFNVSEEWPCLFEICDCHSQIMLDAFTLLFNQDELNKRIPGPDLRVVDGASDGMLVITDVIVPKENAQALLAVRAFLDMVGNWVAVMMYEEDASYWGRMGFERFDKLTPEERAEQVLDNGCDVDVWGLVLEPPGCWHESLKELADG